MTYDPHSGSGQCLIVWNGVVLLTPLRAPLAAAEVLPLPPVPDGAVTATAGGGFHTPFDVGTPVTGPATTVTTAPTSTAKVTAMLPTRERVEPRERIPNRGVCGGQGSRDCCVGIQLKCWQVQVV